MNTYQHRTLPLPADALALFSCLRHLTGSFLLYSGQSFNQSRFDILSAKPVERVHLQTGSSPDQLDAACHQMIARLNQIHAQPAQWPLPGWYGLAAYDLKGTPHPRRTFGHPELTAGFYPAIILVDRRSQLVRCIWLAGYEAEAEFLIGNLRPELLSSSEPFQLRSPFSPNMNQNEYTQRFEQVQQYLHAGDCYQVNLAQRFSSGFQGDPWHAFQTLTNSLPAPMSAYFNGDDFKLLSMSPERFLSIQDGRVTTHPIKGTRPRNANPEVDRQLAEELRNSEKDRAENLMIVDLLRNDLGLSCQPGSINVTGLFTIESYPNVHHLVSHVEGRLRPAVHPLQAFLAAFPGGSITGAPKKRAMEIIAELEPDTRRYYCGSAFYCDVAGRLDSNILIRSLLCENGQIHCWGGGGIVVDSTAKAEYQETLDKVGAILRTLERMSGHQKS